MQTTLTHLVRTLTLFPRRHRRQRNISISRLHRHPCNKLNTLWRRTALLKRPDTDCHSVLATIVENTLWHREAPLRAKYGRVDARTISAWLALDHDNPASIAL